MNLRIVLSCGLRVTAYCFTTTAIVACLGGVNVMGRAVPDSEYQAAYSREIVREKQGLSPDDVHDEHGRVPSWDQYWCTVGGTASVPPTAQSRRLKRYIIEKRRAAGLPELSGGLDYVPAGPLGSFRPDRYYQPGQVKTKSDVERR